MGVLRDFKQAIDDLPGNYQKIKEDAQKLAKVKIVQGMVIGIVAFALILVGAKLILTAF